jgi:tape measure domain-containing protein
MADIYTLKLEDEVTANAKRAAASYQKVQGAAERLANAVASGDRHYVTFAQRMLAQERANLGAAKAAQSAGNALLKLARSEQAASAGADKAAKGTKSFSYALNGLATAAANVAFNLAGKMVGGLLDAGRSMWETAELASRSRQSLSLLYGTVEQGAAVQAKAIELSRKYGLGLGQILSTLTQFKGAGFDLGQSEALIKLGADMRALGSTPEQLDSVFLALRKIQSQGFLQGDELNMLSEAGVSVDKIYSRLEAKLGKTREEIIKMQAARKLSAGNVLNSIAEATLMSAQSTGFGQAGQKAADETLGGLRSRIESNIGADMFEAVQRAEPALVKGLQAVLGGALGANGNTLQDALTNALVKVGAGLENLGPKIPGFIDGLTRLAGVLERMLPTLERFVGNTFAAPATPYQSELPGASLGLDNTQGLGKVLATRPGAIVDIIADFYKQFFTAGQNMSAGLAAGVTAGAPGVAAAASGVAQNAIDATKDTAKIHSPSKAMQPLGGFMAEGVAVGIEDQAHMASRAATTLADGAITGAAVALAPSRTAAAIGKDAGSAFSSSSSRSIGDISIQIDLGAGGTGTVGADSGPVQQIRDFFEQEFIALLDRNLEGSGA